jgi:hypothetical protein
MILKEKYNIPLPANGQWMSSWIDNDDGIHGDIMAVVSSYSDQAGQFTIQQVADRTDAQLLTPIAEGQVQAPGQMCYMTAPVTFLHWRVVFTNGATAQNTFEISVAAGTMQLAILLELQKLNFANRESRGSSNARDEALGYPIGR